MIALIVVICAVVLAYVAYRISGSGGKRRAGDTQPIKPLPAKPKPDTPLADALGPLDKFENKDALKPPRDLPHVVKRKRKKS